MLFRMFVSVRAKVLIFVILVWSLFIGNYHAYAGENETEVLPTIFDSSNLNVEVVVDGLHNPTSMAFLGQNDILVLEKDEGSVRRITNGSLLEEPLLQVDIAEKRKGRLGEAGMLGVAIMNGGSNTDAHVFLYYTESESGDGSEAVSNRLYKYELIGNELKYPELLLDLPGLPPGVTYNNHNNSSENYEDRGVRRTTRLGADHNGGVVTIGPDNNLYLVIGDVGGHKTKDQNFRGGPAPNLTSSILRITQEGKATNTEGILGDQHPLNMYYAYGIRNSFGMDFDPVTGNLWDTENGPDYGDEINLVEPGFNSGWIAVQGFWRPNLEDLRPDGYAAGEVLLNPSYVLESFDGKGKYSDPEFSFKETVGLTALKFLSSDKYGKDYQNDMFVGDLNNGYLYHFDLNENRTELALQGRLADKVADNPNELIKSEINEEGIIIGEGFGGITDIEVGPDGYLYLVSLGYGKIFRIVPTNE
jgi:glucose/arabinose dehydrogenase